MKDFENRVVIITGAAMGLGLASAKELAVRGASLALVDYNEQVLDQTKNDLIKEFPGTRIISIKADVSKEQEVKNYVDETVKAFGRIDGLNNNAGIEGKQARLADYDVDIFKKVLDINLMGAYYGMRYVLPVMKQQQYGRIVNISSVGGILGVLNETAYIASKHALIGMTKTASLEYARYGIYTNAIAPGAIKTAMVEEAFREMNPADPKAAEANFAKANPTGRLGLPDEVARLVAFLLSEGCSYINGQTIAIDGGQSSYYGNVDDMV